MIVWLILVLRLAAASLKSRRNLLLETLPLQHQLLVLSRGSKRPRLTPLDRALWIWLSHTWNGWKVSLRILQPDTVIQWHRAGFRLFWRWKSRARKAGRRTISPDLITLIREMNHANPLRGAPRIHGELLKLNITLAQRTVAKYMVPRSGPRSSHNWKAFLRNYLRSMVSVNFLTVSSMTFKVLYVFIVLSHDRR